MDIQFYLDQIAQDNLKLISFPIFIIAIVLEFWADRKEGLNLYRKNEFIASVWMLVFTLILEAGILLLAFIAFYHIHEITPLKEIIGRQWWAWILLFFIDDFIYYLFHRSNHEVRLFWAGHVPHHSAMTMNFGTAIRQGVGERFHKYFFWLIVPFLGFDPLMIITIMSLNLFYQFWVHTEFVRKLPAPIEYIFNTPSHHRVHHASNIKYLDRNHAGVFIIWDRLLGTFSEELITEKPKYGLTENIKSNQPIHVATHEYQAIWNDVKRADKFTDKLKYIFYAPGWSHDGEDKRAKILRKAVGSNY